MVIMSLVGEMKRKIQEDIENFAKPLREFIKRKHYRGDMLVPLDFALMKIDTVLAEFEQTHVVVEKQKLQELFDNFPAVPITVYHTHGEAQDYIHKVEAYIAKKQDDFLVWRARSEKQMRSLKEFLQYLIEHWENIPIRVKQDGKWQGLFLSEIKDGQQILDWVKDSEERFWKGDVSDA